jgi:hypothetical protein
MTEPDASLNLLTLDDAGFQRLYDGRIAPIFSAREAERQSAMGAFAWRFGATLLVALAVVVIAGATTDDAFRGLVYAAFVVAGGYWFAYRPLADVEQRTKSQSLNAVADAIGCKYESSGFDAPEIDRFRSLELLPGCDRDTFEDLFEGRYQACGYDFYDAHLERKHQSRSGSHWVTVFRGQLIRIAFPKKFQGITVVRRDAGIFNVFERWTTKLQRVGLGDSRLEKAFEVYSNDQVEARYLIHPVFMERLLALEERFKGGRLRCAFEHGELLIAVEGKNRFEIGSMFRTLNDPTRARSVVGDITEIVRVVDAVLTAEQGAPPTN